MFQAANPISAQVVSVASIPIIVMYQIYNPYSVLAVCIHLALSQEENEVITEREPKHGTPDDLQY